MNNKPKRVIDKLIEDVENGCGKISLNEKIILEIQKNNGNEHCLLEPNEEINKIYGNTFLDKLKIEIKKRNIPYIFYASYTAKWSLEYMYSSNFLCFNKDYLKLIIKKQKNIKFLQIIPKILYKYGNLRILNHLKNQNIVNLTIDLRIYKCSDKDAFEHLIFVIKLLKNINIKYLLITPKIWDKTSSISKAYFKYLKKYLQTCCNDTHIILNHIWHDSLITENFWIDSSVTGCNYTVIDKFKNNYHRNFKLKHRIIKQKKRT